MLLILVAIVLLPRPDGRGLEPRWWMMLAVWGGMALVLFCAWGWSRRLLRGMSQSNPLKSLSKAESIMRFTQWIAVFVLAVATFGFGWVELIRSGMGDLLMLDEVVALLPVFLVFVVTWWIFHPFEVRVREGRLIRDLDEGVPISIPPSRKAWVGLQVRTQLLILLLPILLIGSAADLGATLSLMAISDTPMWMERTAAFIAAVPMICLAPWVVVRMMDAVPLPSGEVRTALEETCRRAGVRIRNLMLWRTGGTLYNGAVTGFFPSMRWVLLSDGLVQRLERDEVLAVMAHELAHVRRRHMLWLAASLIASGLAIGFMVDPIVESIQRDLIAGGGDFEELRWKMDWVDLIALGSVLAGVLVMFGWVSRRFERQADAFAAVQLSGGSPGKSVVTVRPEGADAMRSALGAVADLNGVKRQRWSWRHGSIAGRQRHLQSIEGQPSNGLPIDRVVRRINFVSTAVILTAIVIGGMEMLGTDSEEVAQTALVKVE